METKPKLVVYHVLMAIVSFVPTNGRSTNASSRQLFVSDFIVPHHSPLLNSYYIPVPPLAALKAPQVTDNNKSIPRQQSQSDSALPGPFFGYFPNMLTPKDCSVCENSAAAPVPPTNVTECYAHNSEKTNTYVSAASSGIIDINYGQSEIGCAYILLALPPFKYVKLKCTDVEKATLVIDSPATPDDNFALDTEYTSTLSHIIFHTEAQNAIGASYKCSWYMVK